MRFISPDAKRQDAASAYLHPKLQSGKHPNLHVLVSSQVARVSFENKRAVGVELKLNLDWHAGTESQQIVGSVKARELVIVSCGAFGTPPLLERSGVGDSEILQRAGASLWPRYTESVRIIRIITSSCTLTTPAWRSKKPSTHFSVAV
jgi:choline dehydrogenase-like flavoprotein